MSQSTIAAQTAAQQKTDPTGPATGNSYIERKIKLTILLGKGKFGESGENTVILENLRVHASIQKNGPPANSSASLRVYGVTQSVMNVISTLGVPSGTAVRDNSIEIEAGDAVSGMTLVFAADLYKVYQNFSDMPDTFLQMDCLGMHTGQLKTTTPISFSGSVDVALVMSGIANRIPGGRLFENNGVDTKVSDLYLPGNPTEQANALARLADIGMADDGKVLAIWPKGGHRGGAIPLVSPASGLVGYPAFSDYGIRFRCLFNPSIAYGAQIQMDTDYEPANGTWTVRTLSYDLASELPGGPWFCDVDCYRAGTSPQPASR